MTRLDIDRAKYKPAEPVAGKLVMPFLYPKRIPFGRRPFLKLFLETYQGPAEDPLRIELFRTNKFIRHLPHGEAYAPDEGSGAAPLASFQAVPARNGNRCYWKDVEPLHGAVAEAPERHVPYIRFGLAGPQCRKWPENDEQAMEKGASGVPVFFIPIPETGGKSLEEIFEIGYAVKASDGTMLADRRRALCQIFFNRHFTPFSHECAPVLGLLTEGLGMEEWLQGRYARGDRLVQPTEPQIIAKKRQEARRALKQAMEELEAHLEEATGFYDIYVKRYRDYLWEWQSYVSLVDGLLEGSPGVDMSYYNHLSAKRRELEERKRELDDYLSTSGAIPRGFNEAAQMLKAKQERNQAIDGFLNHPVIQILTLLPGGDAFVGLFDIVKGDYRAGLMKIGMDLLTFGSFKKISVMADLVDEFQKASQAGRSGIGTLLEYRYFKVAAGRLGRVDTLYELAGRADPGFRGLWEAVKNCKRLGAFGEEMTCLLRSRKVLKEIVGRAGRGLPVNNAGEFLAFLKDTELYHDFLLVAAAMRPIVYGEGIRQGVASLGEAETPEQKLQRSMQALKGLGEFSHLLPNSEAAAESAAYVLQLLHSLEGEQILIERLLAKIPESEIKARMQQEVNEQQNRNPWLARLNPGSASFTREQLAEMLDRIRKGFEFELPRRQALKKSGGSLTAFEFSQFDMEFEKVVDKLTGYLESRFRHIGMDIQIRCWFYSGWVIGKTEVILEAGAYEIGLDRCDWGIRVVG